MTLPKDIGKKLKLARLEADLTQVTNAVRAIQLDSAN